jgi:hypothetical protein
MQNSWCFVEDPALRDRLKEAKGRCAVTSYLCRPPAAQKAAASLSRRPVWRERGTINAGCAFS